MPFNSAILERRFQQHWYTSSKRQIRVAMGLSVVLLLAFGLLDASYFSEPLIDQVRWFRWLVILPACGVIFASTFSAMRGQYVYLMMTVTLSLMTWYFASLATALGPLAVSYLLPLFVQLALLQLVLLRVPLRMSLLASALALFLGARAFLATDLATAQMVSVVGGLVAIHCILLFSAYQRETQQRELFVSNQQLRQSLADRDQVDDERASWYRNLAQFLRHELSNQLVGARTSLQLIERFSDRRLEYLGRARRSLDRMQLMLNETSNASSVEEALKSEEREAFDLTLLVAETTADYRDQYPSCEFQFALDPGVRLVGQPFRIAQLLDKLVSNAVRYAEPQTPIDISLRVLPELQTIELSVANRGQALPSDTDALFNLWSTSAGHAEQGRLGLGLYVAARVAEAHGGNIRAEPLVGVAGARFTVSLPLALRQPM
ncbi:MAG: sensor histidine kinase [Pseudomonadales bacterium]